MKTKHPRFVRQNLSQKKRVRHTGWRKPRGIDNKQRVGLKSAGALPKIGYQGPRSERHKHPSGFYEMRVFNEKDLLKINPKTHACRLGASVGERKRIVLRKKAAELGIHVF